MATSDPGPGPDSLFGEFNKLQSKVDEFREVIERKKLEVRRVSEEMRSLIQRKEEAIIQELEGILEELFDGIERKKKEVQNDIQEIEVRRKEMEDIFLKLNPRQIQFPQISEAIDLVKAEIDIEIPNVVLWWRVDKLEDSINRMCSCEQQILAYNQYSHFQLKWSNCESGSRENQLNVPWGIATNPVNDNVYVADNRNHRIQLFSKEGEWIRLVRDDEMKLPENILFHNDSIYVQCERAILKLNELTEKKEKSISYKTDLRGICTDNAHIYVGNCKGMNIMALTKDLIEEGTIPLKTEFSKHSTRIRDISLSKDSFYILLFDTEYPIQTFSREGVLTRCVVKKYNIINAYSFCLDQQLNILVADHGSSRVKIFSNEGKLLTQIGVKGTGKGQLRCLRGIFVSQLGCIITTDSGKNSNKLQAFMIS